VGGVRVDVSRFLYLLDIDDVYCVKLVLDEERESGLRVISSVLLCLCLCK
jgi:hypothetical protein